MLPRPGGGGHPLPVRAPGGPATLQLPQQHHGRGGAAHERTGAPGQSTPRRGGDGGGVVRGDKGNGGGGVVGLKAKVQVYEV